MKLPRPARSLGAAPRRLFGGYGPLLALAIAFVLVVTLVPTIAREETVGLRRRRAARSDGSTDLGGDDRRHRPAAAVIPGAPGAQQPGVASTTQAPPAPASRRTRRRRRLRRPQAAGPGRPLLAAVHRVAGREGQRRRDLPRRHQGQDPRRLPPAGGEHQGLPEHHLRARRRTRPTRSRSRPRRTSGARCENLVTYFERNFQFYGRKIELVEWKGKGSVFNEIVGAGQEAANADAIKAAKELKVFADVERVHPALRRRAGPPAGALDRRPVHVARVVRAAAALRVEPVPGLHLAVGDHRRVHEQARVRLPGRRTPVRASRASRARSA